MDKRTIVAVDAMGGDNAPKEIIKGAVDALINPSLEILLVGKQDLLEKELSGLSYDNKRLKIVNATEVIGMDEVPTAAIKQKKDSSMVVAMRLVKEGAAEAVVSAGNSGALLTGATLIIGRIKGIDRPALGTCLPNENGYTFLIDSGANMDCKPQYLPQFALMGSVYMESIQKVKNPKVGLINVGAEKEKGNALTKDAYELLEKYPGINFTGNVEARYIPKCQVDVAVCDAFVGNVVLKLTEGLASSLMRMIKRALMSSTKAKLGALLIKGSLKELSKGFDYAEVGGAPFLGLKSIVIKAHGSSNAKAVKNAVGQAYAFASLNLSAEIEKRLAAQGNTESE
ncbi:MAG: phosphate acyltransferase PlsX [Clostridiales bacterium]|jgi:glycerol-3-phosphate acyltransferase PlsX|nr:phosphate acyltransferase PlsX [Clostridiales bacterium]